MKLPPDPWSPLRAHTSARIAIGRVGASLPTREVLSFALSHAKARDAVHARLDRAALASEIKALGLDTIEVESCAHGRAVYLARPDLGRQLHPTSRARLTALAVAQPCDVLVIVGDGLSATAVAQNAVPVISALLPLLKRQSHGLGPVVLAEGTRVALGDEIGQLLGARLVLLLIGERPGLSAADSMSAYLTFAPRPGRTDAERNCVSNIRPGGLAPEPAAASLAWLVSMALKTGATGTVLKDDSAVPLIAND